MEKPWLALKNGLSMRPSHRKKQIRFGSDFRRKLAGGKGRRITSELLHHQRCLLMHGPTNYCSSPGA